jgi:biopolymer transport protein ExbD
MRINRDRKSGIVEGDMTPMIDMTFQLIAFFMVLLNFSDVEQSQEINLPASELAKPPDVPYDEPLTVQLKADGTVIFASEEMTIDGLAPHLVTESQVIRAHQEKRMSDVTVIIRADELAKSGDVQRIIQKCQDAEFDTFALRGRQSDQPTLFEP